MRHTGELAVGDVKAFAAIVATHRLAAEQLHHLVSQAAWLRQRKFVIRAIDAHGSCCCVAHAN